MAHRHDVDRFNRWAGEYDRHWMQRVIFEPVQRTVLNLAADQVPQPDAILDVGCGTERLLGFAEGRFPTARLVPVEATIALGRQEQASSPAGQTLFPQATADYPASPAASFPVIRRIP